MAIKRILTFALLLAFMMITTAHATTLFTALLSIWPDALLWRFHPNIRVDYA